MARGEPPVAGGVLSLQPPHRPLAARGRRKCRQVLERYLPALEEVARAHDGETIALFSHGAALRIVLGTLQGLTLREVGTSPHGDNTAVSLLEYEKRPLPRRFPATTTAT